MKAIPLTQDKVALVDDEDFERVAAFKWHAYLSHGRHWYAMRTLPGTTQKMHRFIMGLENGDPHQVDHIDRVNTLDNRKSNLRITLNQNQQNMGLPIDNTSGFKGVSWSKVAKRWNAQISVHGRRTHLGNFLTREAAARAYDAAALKFYGPFAVTNAMLGLLKKPVQSALAQAA